MKIESVVTVTMNNAEDPKVLLKVLTPFDTQTKVILDDYANHKSWGPEMPNIMKHPTGDIVLAIGIPEQKETTADVLKKGKELEWFPASLEHWNAYRKVHKGDLHHVALFGTHYRDDNLCEWIFTVNHKKLFGMSQVYELTAKPWGMLRHKILPVLLVKISRKKT